MINFNEELIEKQNVTAEQKQELEHIYKLLEGTVTIATDLQTSDNLTHTTGSVISNTIRDIEFMLQKNWNFPQNEDYHTYQLKLPGCLCPKMDNEDSFGSSYKWTNQECPYHGIKATNET